jgi:hypothetical protein
MAIATSCQTPHAHLQGLCRLGETLDIIVERVYPEVYLLGSQGRGKPPCLVASTTPNVSYRKPIAVRWCHVRGAVAGKISQGIRAEDPGFTYRDIMPR